MSAEITSAQGKPLWREAASLLAQAWSGFQRHNSAWLAAALAYFGAFAVAPLIIVLVEIAGVFIHDHQHVLDFIFQHLGRGAGPGTDAVRDIVASTIGQPRTGLVSQIAGWVVFVVAAVGMFGALQFALNTVWDVTPAKMTIWQTVRLRAWAFFIVAVIALLLLLSIGINAVIAAVAAHAPNVLLGSAALAKIGDFIASFLVLWIGFALIFEYLPQIRIAWRDVWIGAGTASFLFVVGQVLLGWYIARVGMSSAYGAFSSLVAFLIWINYSAQIVLFGAELTHVYALRDGVLPPQN